MNFRPSSSVDYEEIDQVEMLSRAHVVQETLTADTSVAADNTSDEMMQNNPAYGHI